MSISSDIRAASNSLNEENWHQGSYFASKNVALCMCAHGALQAKVNPLVVEIIRRYLTDSAGVVVEEVSSAGVLRQETIAVTAKGAAAAVVVEAVG